jgi:TRAP-type C4-dicarboxylate transport system substrate-binding protein
MSGRGLWMLGALSGLLIALALAANCAGAWASEVTLRLHHFLPADSIEQTRVLEPWARRIEEGSGGRIAIEILPDMALGGTPADLFEQAQDGTVDLVLTMPAFTPGRFALAEVFELPFMAASAEATSQALSALMEERPDEGLEAVHPILFHVHAPASLHMAPKRVQRLEDVQDVKIYAPTAGASAALEVLGAAPVTIAGTEMRHALARHRVEGGAFALALAPDLGVADVPKHHTIVPGLYTSVFMLVMNRGRYEQLPDDLKAVIDANAGQRFAAEAGRVWDEAELAAMQAVEDEGFFVLDYLELERWRAAAQPAISAWAERTTQDGEDGDTLLGHVRSLLASFAGRS